MDTSTCCRRLESDELYRTILLEEGCDMDAPCRNLAAPAVEFSVWIKQWPLALVRDFESA